MADCVGEEACDSRFPRTSSISLAAVADADDFDGVFTLLAIDKSPSTDAEPEQRRVETFELFDVANVGLQKPGHRQKSHGCIAVDGAFSHRAS
jgi:hypothetical protein